MLVRYATIRLLLLVVFLNTTLASWAHESLHLHEACAESRVADGAQHSCDKSDTDEGHARHADCKLILMK